MTLVLLFFDLISPISINTNPTTSHNSFPNENDNEYMMMSNHVHNNFYYISATSLITLISSWLGRQLMLNQAIYFLKEFIYFSWVFIISLIFVFFSRLNFIWFFSIFIVTHLILDLQLLFEFLNYQTQFVNSEFQFLDKLFDALNFRCTCASQYYQSTISRR